MKKIFLFLVILATSIQNSFAVESGNLVETDSKIDLISTLFSAETLLNIILAMVVIVMTFVIALIVRTKLFSYLETSI